jgi:hypothetical protein
MCADISESSLNLLITVFDILCQQTQLEPLYVLTGNTQPCQELLKAVAEILIVKSGLETTIIADVNYIGVY